MRRMRLDNRVWLRIYTQGRMVRDMSDELVNREEGDGAYGLQAALNVACNMIDGNEHVKAVVIYNGKPEEGGKLVARIVPDGEVD